MGPGRPDEPLSPGGKKSRRPPITPVPKKRAQHPTWTDAPAVHPAQLSRQCAFRPARRQAVSSARVR